MGRNINPPIKGHTLLHEGRMWLNYRPDGTMRVNGGCFCGELPPGVDHDVVNPCELPSIAKVKRWHREHKAALRGVL